MPALPTSALRTRSFAAAAPVRPAFSRKQVTVLANKKVQKKQKVILVADLPNVGKTGDIKSVPVGYWRNFLLPNGIAKVASESILSQIKRDKEDAIRKKLEEKAQAQALGNALATIGKFVLKKRVGDRDQIYGSVSVKEIVDAIYQQTGRDLSMNNFEVPEIKSIGTYEVRVQLHSEVKASFNIVIQREKLAPAGKKA